MPGGAATMLASSVTSVLKQNPQPGISQHVHLCIVRRGSVQIWPNDHSYTGRWELWSLGPPNDRSQQENPEVTNFRMPPVATTYEELLSMLRGDAKLATDAVAGIDLGVEKKNYRSFISSQLK